MILKVKYESANESKFPCAELKLTEMLKHWCSFERKDVRIHDYAMFLNASVWCHVCGSCSLMCVCVCVLAYWVPFSVLWNNQVTIWCGFTLFSIHPLFASRQPITGHTHTQTRTHSHIQTILSLQSPWCVGFRPVGRNRRKPTWGRFRLPFQLKQLWEKQTISIFLFLNPRDDSY